MSRPDRSGPARLRRAAGILLPLLTSVVATGISSVLAAPERLPLPPAAPQPAASTPGSFPLRSAASAPGAEADADRLRGGFEATLRSHLLLEGHRQRIDQPLLGATPSLFEEAIDDATAADSGRRAGRTI
ncbi:MAG TPA: hypothetical protein VMQ62_10020, partial [Dongiaceae bacterium]|nr:hypothetical protein [Dongiaceae bacterium]